MCIWPLIMYQSGPILSCASWRGVVWCKSIRMSATRDHSKMFFFHEKRKALFKLVCIFYKQFFLNLCHCFYLTVTYLKVKFSCYFHSMRFSQTARASKNDSAASAQYSVFFSLKSPPGIFINYEFFGIFYFHNLSALRY